MKNTKLIFIILIGLCTCTLAVPVLASSGWELVAAKYNGQTQIYSLISYDDGTGEAIYGGTMEDGMLFKYNSTTGGWLMVAAKYNGQTEIHSLISYDDGTGEAIYGGAMMDGMLFKYNSTTGGWKSVASKLDYQSYIHSLITYDDGTGEAIYGGTGPRGCLFKYNSTTGGWKSVAPSLNDQFHIQSLTTYDDGTGEAIYGGTGPEGCLFKYNSTTGGWKSVAPSLNDQTYIRSLTTYDDGTGEAIYGGTGPNGYLFKYNSTTGGWKNVANPSTNQKNILSLITYDDGTGEAIYGGTMMDGMLFKYNSTTGGWLMVAAKYNNEMFVNSLTKCFDGERVALYGGTGFKGNLFKFTHTLSNIPLTANFIASSTTSSPDVVITFTDTSVGNPEYWHWDFGDGSTSSQENPSYSYTSVGDYTVSLIVANTAGTDEKIVTNYISIKDKPIASFTATPTTGEKSMTVQFIDSSTNGPTNWHWEFGDGSTSSEQNPSHTYSTAGTYTVQLQSSNQYGSSTHSITNFISVYNPPSQPWGFEEENFSQTEYGLITLNATGITDNTVTLNGIAPVSDSEYRVFFSIGTTSGHYAYMTEFQDIEGNYNETLTGMPIMPGKTFYYRAGSESGAYGEEKSFTVGEMEEFIETNYGKYADEFLETDGDFIGMLMVIWKPYENMWSGTLFYGLLLSTTFIALAWRQQSVIVSATLYILIGFPLASMFPPEFYKIGMIMFVIAIGGFIYWVFTKTR